MSAHSLKSQDVADGREMLGNCLALIALLAIGIVWPPTNTANANADTAGRTAIRTHAAAVTDKAPTRWSRRACEGGSPARTR